MIEHLSAALAFVAALEISPEHGKSLVNLGRVLLDADRAAEALVRLEKACEGLPRVVEILLRHGLEPDEPFLMEPGFENFSPVERGQLLETGLISRTTNPRTLGPSDSTSSGLIP